MEPRAGIYYYRRGHRCAAASGPAAAGGPARDPRHGPYGYPGGTGSGDIFLAFSTARRVEGSTLEPLPSLAYIPNDWIDPVFEATVQAVEEAILNALIAAETMTGWNGQRVVALDHARLQEILRAHSRLNES